MLLKALLVFTLCACSIEAAVIKPRTSRAKLPWGLMEAITATSQIRGFSGTWITDEEFYYTASDKSIHKYNALSNMDSVFVPSEILELYNGTFTLSPDNKKLLVRYAVEQVFRHSRIAKYDVFDIETKTATQIKDGEKLQYCAWSPVTDKLSFVFKNNAYVFVDENSGIALTDDGVSGVIYNGIPDWVYEEEVLSSGSAMWWSKDGLKLAVGFFNDTNVQTFKYHIYGDAEDPKYQYPEEVDLKYPKPGTPNPTVALRIFDITDPKPQLVSVVRAPENIVSEDHILQNVAWVDNKTILITWLNRRQNIASLQLCAVPGECQEVLHLYEPDGWITMGSPMCLKSGKNCVFTYWIGEWSQVWNLDLGTGRNIWQSRGDFTVLQVYGYDEENDKLYYRATLTNDPSVYHVFSNDDCLSCDLLDVDGQKCESASASFSKNYSYYTITCGGPTPSYTKIFETMTRTEVANWESNTDFREKLQGKLLPTIRYMNVTLADGSIGYARMELPPNFNEKRKYPMVVNVYGGPNSVRITHAFGVGFNAYMATNREVIYTTIDGRGTGNKGKKLLFSVNNNLGEHEVEDQLHVTRFLQKTYAFIDGDRCGIWGWSYGGYMTAKVLANDTDRVFQCGVSVAPVTSWIYYDTIYTERYMGLPTPEDNLSKYYESGVLERIDNFRNHDFLLIHGSGDDNVHYQQSLMLAKVLQHNDILFEEMTYTDENHAIGNLLPHLYNTIDNFWINCLNLEVDNNEF